MKRLVLALTAGALVVSGCAATTATSSWPTGTTSAAATAAAPGARPSATGGSSAAVTGPQLAGMPPLLDAHDVYAADRPGALSAAVSHDLARVYVPNTGSDTVTVIDPATYRILGTMHVGHQPQHVVPAWDLRTLWVNNDLGNSLTPIDPRTGRAGRAVPVADPYNLYFTPDGRHAVVMASALHRLDFRDPHTMALQRSVPVPCSGVNHADWTADGRFFLVSCEFSGQLLWVDTAREKVLAVIRLPHGSMPQDVKISPDGRRFYVADMMSNGVWVYDYTTGTPRLETMLRTGMGAHGLYVSRDSRFLYVSNRGEGTISVVRFADDRIVQRWTIPGHASPDMGNLSADGRVLWLSGRYDGEVYALDTATGHLLARIKVGIQPHGLTVWPQPGRYSLGHTGILR